MLGKSFGCDWGWEVSFVYGVCSTGQLIWGPFFLLSFPFLVWVEWIFCNLQSFVIISEGKDGWMARQRCCFGYFFAHPIINIPYNIDIS